MDKKTLEAAALAAGMSARSARTWKTGPLPSQTKEPRDWCTRADPFSEVWESEVVPLLEADDRGVLEAKTVIDVLADKHPGRYADGQIRTMQRRMRVWRMRVWRAQSGPPKEAYFEQRHEPGREGSFDFTHGTELRVTILGQSFIHLIFEFVLSFSGWTWVMLAFGETFEALVAGVQGALWELEGCRRCCVTTTSRQRPTSSSAPADARSTSASPTCLITMTRARPASRLARAMRMASRRRPTTC